MRRDGRLSIALHALLHMAERGSVMTSETIGQLMAANPVVVRRTMAGLRDAGIVSSEKGHGGGWSLARPLGEVSLEDVLDALGPPTLFQIGPRDESPGCLVEQAVNRALGQALGDAESRLRASLGAASVADIAADVHRRAPRPASKPRGRGSP